jgi:hypothetical protein
LSICPSRTKGPKHALQMCIHPVEEFLDRAKCSVVSGRSLPHRGQTLVSRPGATDVLFAAAGAVARSLRRRGAEGFGRLDRGNFLHARQTPSPSANSDGAISSEQLEQ